MIRNARRPIIGFAAYSGTGKTTLLVKLLPILRERGLRVGVVKHAHHSFEVDQEGKDSFALRRAGADSMLIASRNLWALMKETPGQEEPDLDALLAYLDQDALDLILVEGFKHERFPKIELHRPSTGRPLLFPRDPSVLAVATDAPLTAATTLPVLDLNSPTAIAQFIAETVAGTTWAEEAQGLPGKA